MSVSRGTKCFSGFHGSECQGAFPKNFLKWVKEQGWWSESRLHLCSGLLKDEESFKVDIRAETNPNLIADATDTGLEDERFNWVMIDPPYSKELAQKLYKTQEHYYSINEFVKEGIRLVKPAGLVCTLSYEVPKKPKNADIIAVWGVYTVPHTSFIRCFTVFKKEGGLK